LKISAFRSETFHSSAHLGNQTRVAIQFQYVARGCPVRLPVTHAGSRPLAFDMAHPTRLAITLDSVGAHAGGAAEDPSPGMIAMQPAALAGLDLANLDMRTALNVTAAYSSSDYLRRPPIPWRRNVLLMDGGAAESRARVDRKHGLWGVLRSGKDITASQSCHLAAFDITTKVGAWGIPSHALHYHDFDVQEVC
jgi:hypothetical protein